MSDISERLRGQVEARAQRRCEYCGIPSEWQVGGFPVDHVIPRTEGGTTDLTNLALACPHCNGRKWAHTVGIDGASGTTVSLFHPRNQSWYDHFRKSVERPFELEGITPTGRATISRLQMNHADQVDIRRLLAKLGLNWTM